MSDELGILEIADDELDPELLAELLEAAAECDGRVEEEGDDSDNAPPEKIGPSLMLAPPAMAWGDELEIICATDADGVPLAVSWRGKALKYTVSGNRVRACKLALGKAGCRDNEKWGYGRFYGGQMVKDVRAFQKAKGLKVDGQIGRDTFLKLRPYFTPQAKKLWTKATTVTRYEKIAVVGLLLWRNRAAVHYSYPAHNDLRMWGVKHHVRYKGNSTTVIPWGDCSSIATDLCYIAGFPDPNGRGYDGYGYSGSQYADGKVVTSGFLGGDTGTYGPAGIKHATVFLSPTVMLSHGCEAGPLLYTGAHPERYRSDFARVTRHT